MALWLCLWLCSFTTETTFPLSNFKTKHIFGILWHGSRFWNYLGRRRRPNSFFYHRRPRWSAGGTPIIFIFLRILLTPPKAAVSQIGPQGAPKVAPKAPQRWHRRRPKGGAEGTTMAPLSRKVREIPPKAGVSRVYIIIYIYMYIGGVGSPHPLESMYAIIHIKWSPTQPLQKEASCRRRAIYPTRELAIFFIFFYIVSVHPYFFLILLSLQ